MLIKCPECGKEISDKAGACINCGCPIKSNNLCTVNGRDYDLSFLLDDSKDYSSKLVEFVQLTDCYFGDSGDEIDKIINNKQIPKFLNISTNEEREKNTPHCPTCNSTNVEKISLTKKAVGGAAFGLFSSNIRNTMHCKNCGAKW